MNYLNAKLLFWILALVLIAGLPIPQANGQHGKAVQMTPLNRQFGILTVEPSGDGRYTMITTFKEVRVIDNQTGAELLAVERSPRQHIFKIGSINDRCILAVFEKGANSQAPYSIFVYDVKARKEIKRLAIPRFTEAYGMVISQDGRKLLLLNKSISVFDTLSLTPIAKTKNPMQSGGRFVFIPGSHHVLLSGIEKNNWILKLWDYQSNRFDSWKKMDHEVSSIAVSPNGRTGAFNSRHGIKFFDLSSKTPFEFTASINAGVPRQAAIGFTNNGERIWAVTATTLRGWNVNSGEAIANERFRFKCFHFLSGNGKLQYVSERDQFAMRELNLGEAIRDSSAPVWLRELDIADGSPVHFIDSDKFLHWNRQRSQVHITDLKTGHTQGELKLPALSDGERYELFSCGLFRVGKESLGKLNYHKNRFDQSFVAPKGNSIDAVTESKNGELVINCSLRSADVQFFSQTSKPTTATYLMDHDSTVKQLPPFQQFDEVCVSSKMKFVALRTDNRVRIWDLKRELEIGEIQLQDILCFSGNQLVGKQSRDYVRYDWHSDTTTKFAPFAVDGTVKTIAEGRALISASGGFVRIWNIQGDKLVGIVKLERSQQINELQCSPDGQHLLIQFEDGSAGAWQIN